MSINPKVSPRTGILFCTFFILALAACSGDDGSIPGDDIAATAEATAAATAADTPHPTQTLPPEPAGTPPGRRV